jgi:hypothetical protein
MGCHRPSLQLLYHGRAYLDTLRSMLRKAHKQSISPARRHSYSSSFHQTILFRSHAHDCSTSATARLLRLCEPHSPHLPSVNAHVLRHARSGLPNDAAMLRVSLDQPSSCGLLAGPPFRYRTLLVWQVAAHYQTRGSRQYESVLSLARCARCPTAGAKLTSLDCRRSLVWRHRAIINQQSPNGGKGSQS